ncbi:hypothetical protein D3C75_1208910 [compost metagenome]
MRRSGSSGSSGSARRGQKVKEVVECEEEWSCGSSWSVRGGVVNENERNELHDDSAQQMIAI